MAIRLCFAAPAGHGHTNIECGSVHGGRSHSHHKVNPLQIRMRFFAPTGIQYGEKPDKFGWIYKIK